MAAPGPGDQMRILIRTKLQRPRLSGDLIPRPRLMARLDRVMERKLIVISTPAGYGKTTLLLQWFDTLEAKPSPIEDREGKIQTRVAWLSLDQGDSDLGIFLRYLLAAVRSAYPATCPAMNDMLEASQQAPRDYLVAMLANDLAELPGDLLLALGDFQVIEGRQVSAFLSDLLDYLPQKVHLAISTRQDPDLPLARLRALRQMVELRATDLEFTPEEARDFLSQTSTGALSDKAMGLLEEHTEGWIVGLRLAALALRNAADPDAYLENFRGAEWRYMMDYLADDVLSQQPPVVREFLLQTSVLERISGPLCDAVVELGAAHPNSHELISALEGANLFIVPLGGEGQWYRYHQLFRELLQRQLGQSHSEEAFRSLHRRASIWFEAEGSIEEAIRHAVAAQEPVTAAQIVERQVREALDHGNWFSLNHWLGLLPEGLVEERVALVLTKAWQLATVFRFMELPPLIAHAEDLCASRGAELDEQAQRALKGEILGLKSLVAMSTLQSRRAVDLAERALALMPRHHELPRGATLLALGLALQSAGELERAIDVLPSRLEVSGGGPDRAMYSATATLAAIHLQAGNLDEAIRVARQPLDLGPEARPPTAGWSHYLIGVCRYLRDELEQAECHFSAGAALHHHTTPKIFQENQFGLALTYQAQGRDSEADQICQELQRLATGTARTSSLREIASFRARLELLRGEAECAHHWLATPGSWVPRGLMVFLEIPHLTYAHYLAVCGSGERRQEGIELLTEFLQTAESTHNNWRILEGVALRSLVLWAHGRREEALADLKRAILLARPRGIVRPFIDLGPGMADLLRQIAQKGIEPAYAHRLLASFSEPAKEIGQAIAPKPTASIEPPLSVVGGRSSPLIEPLTEREMEVLALLGERLTNQEIAQRLVIALPTVKRHTSNIYAKLDVPNRREAVARARELAILSSD